MSRLSAPVHTADEIGVRSPCEHALQWCWVFFVLACSFWELSRSWNELWNTKIARVFRNGVHSAAKFEVRVAGSLRLSLSYGREFRFLRSRTVARVLPPDSHVSESPSKSFTAD